MAELRLLLDTQAIIIWSVEPERLPPHVREALAEPANKIYFSAVSAMEIATKVRIGKLDIARPLVIDFAGQMVERGFVELPLLSKHAEMAGSFVSTNNDPWDRLLAAQAKLEKMLLVTGDGRMEGFDVEILW